MGNVTINISLSKKANQIVEVEQARLRIKGVKKTKAETIVQLLESVKIN
jgi:hypothetical protein